jgi:monoamine oxidase
MANLTVDGGVSFPFAAIQSGPAIKYLAPLASRFWLTASEGVGPTSVSGLAPSGMSDALGMTWEGTDNQAVLQVSPGSSQFDLTVFVGGPLAQAALNAAGGPNFPDNYFQQGVAALYPGFQVTSPGTFCCAPVNGYTMAGYSCPGVKQVTATDQGVASQYNYAIPYNNLVYLAGEHTSPAWFGFMEGALESGLLAALRIGVAAGMGIDMPYGTIVTP